MNHNVQDVDCERNSAGDILPVPKSVKVVTVLPKTRSINGRSAPDDIAAMKAMKFRIHPVLSV